MISAPPKFVVNTLDESTIEKIELSFAASEDMEFREIHCPYCSTPLATVTLNMKEGIFIAKCQKCKAVTPLNLAYFYRSRTYRLIACLKSEWGYKDDDAAVIDVERKKKALRK